MAPPPRAALLALLLGALAEAATDFGQRSCCALAEAELTEAFGSAGDTCPDESWYRSVDKCGGCPPGTCRVTYRDGDDYCYCPKRFINDYKEADSDGLHTRCELSFGKPWPDSIGLEDVNWRSCQDGAVAPDFGTKSCCDLSEADLAKAFGTGDACPDDSWYKSVDKCGSCPPGTCRVTYRDGDDYCYCPKRFVKEYGARKSGGLYTRCEISFGKPWPESIGREDVNWKSCGSTGSGGTGSSGAGAADSGDSKPSANPGDEETDNAGGIETDAKERDSAAAGGDEDDGIKWEKWGVIWGVVGVAVAIIFGVLGVWYSRRQQALNSGSGTGTP